jgi:hypothetical protein
MFGHFREKQYFNKKLNFKPVFRIRIALIRIRHFTLNQIRIRPFTVMRTRIRFFSDPDPAPLRPIAYRTSKAPF